MAFAMSKSSAAGGSAWAEPGCCSAVLPAVTNTEVADLILVTHEVRDRRPALRQDEVAMLSVSTTATWSRMAAIHTRCDRYFWAFAAHFARPRQHPARSQEHQCQSQVVLVAEGDAPPFRACCSWLRFFRGAAQTTRTGSNCFVGMAQPTSWGRTL